MNEPTETTEWKQSRKNWTGKEVQTVRDYSHLGVQALSEMLGRSESSIEHLAHRLRISLRRKGEQRGTILGQPRGVRWIDQEGVDRARLSAIRADIVEGNTNPAELESRVREIALGSDKPICPSCGVRPQVRPTTGLCEVCHLRALAQAHRDDQATRDAQRELWRARQESSRSRRAKNGDQ